jgi:phosphoglycolate phosphatase-like HAD superfamily hydrolase
VAVFGDDHLVRAELIDIARQRAEAEYGVPGPAQAVVITGDTPLDIEAAHAREARAVAIATGAHSVEELAAAGADIVLSDLLHLEELITAITSG